MSEDLNHEDIQSEPLQSETPSDGNSSEIVSAENVASPNSKKDDRVSKFASISLMVAILAIAGIFSAMTAMRIAIRGREVAVPDLQNKTEAEARQLLESKGLSLRVAQSQFTPGVPEGRVVEQIPPAGTHLKTSRSVKVLTSLGERRYPVPNVIGDSERAAQLTLAESKLKLGATDRAHTTEGGRDTVVYQSPPPDAVGGTDPKVNILISLGPLEEFFIMPDLVGKPIDSVMARARIEGFKVAKPNLRSYPGIAPGVVIQQKPQAGYRLSKNDSILLDVSQ
jgi:eukaryotic-like serine/threonine-protein kinase